MLSSRNRSAAVIPTKYALQEVRPKLMPFQSNAILTSATVITYCPRKDPIAECSTCCCDSSENVEFYNPDRPEPWCSAPPAVYTVTFVSTWTGPRLLPLHCPLVSSDWSLSHDWLPDVGCLHGRRVSWSGTGVSDHTDRWRVQSQQRSYSGHVQR